MFYFIFGTFNEYFMCLKMVYWFCCCGTLTVPTYVISSCEQSSRHLPVTR